MPKKPELEYIHRSQLDCIKHHPGDYKDEIECLQTLAQGTLKKGPISITTGKSPPHIAASGDKRDFLSYAPYYWPDGNRYVRHDGKRNPDCSLVKDQSHLEAFAENLTYLCLGYYLLGVGEYANHATLLTDSFLVNSDMRMNPNVEYGQVIRGETNPSGKGRPEGIISTRSLARVANVLPLIADHPSYLPIAEPVQAWFTEYLHWLQHSSIGKKEAGRKNNQQTWYFVQVAQIQQFLGDRAGALATVQSFFKNEFPKQVDDKGNQPHESNRARPFHYLEFNLHAAIFLAEMGIGLGYCAYEENPCLIDKATSYMIWNCHEDDPREDMTEGVRTVEIVKNRCGDNPATNAYTRFLDKARRCKKAENICGPKHAIAALWTPQPQHHSPQQEIEDGKLYRVKEIIHHLFNHNK